MFPLGPGPFPAFPSTEGRVDFVQASALCPQRPPLCLHHSLLTNSVRSGESATQCLPSHIILMRDSCKGILPAFPEVMVVIKQLAEGRWWSTSRAL